MSVALPMSEAGDFCRRKSIKIQVVVTYLVRDLVCLDMWHQKYNMKAQFMQLDSP